MEEQLRSDNAQQREKKIGAVRTQEQTICRSCVWLSAIENEEKINCRYQ